MDMIRIFLIDHALEDPRCIGGLLRASLTSDFSLSCAATYREILAGFRSKQYDVYLIDSAAGNGLKLFAQARSLGCAAPFVLVTSNHAGEVLGALRSGVSDCLIRNELTVSQIERTICSVVEQARGSSLQLERERRYLGLLDNAREIIFTLDLTGDFTSINQMGEQVFGFTHRELLNLNISQIVTTDHRGLLQKLIARTLDAQTQTFEEIDMMTKQGYRMTLGVGTHPIFQQGKPVEIQGIATTPRKPLAPQRPSHGNHYIDEVPRDLDARLVHDDNRLNYFLDSSDNFSLQESI